jgi:HAD superfamily hydrolase (TIGR01490 family)
MTTIAFFDVDETLITFKSMLSFTQFLASDAGAPLLASDRARAFRLATERAKTSEISREQLNALYYEQFTGVDVRALADLGTRWYRAARSEQGERFFNACVLNALRDHVARGTEVVLLSGSFDVCLAPMLDELKVPCQTFFASLEKRGNSYTGRVLAPRTVGPGKAEVARSHAAQRGALLKDCYAYADDISDLELLEIVGTPRVIAGCPELESIARSRGWDVWRSRSGAIQSRAIQTASRTEN